MICKNSGRQRNYTSTILALVVLAGALLLLQIIGVNVLGLFTFQEYTTIIGG